MSNAFTSWHERPEKLLSSRDTATTDDASTTHPTAKWIQEQSQLNSSSPRTDELDQFGIPIHPSQHSSTRSTSKRDATLPRSPTLTSSAAFRPSSSSRHLLSPDAHASPSTSSQALPIDPSPSVSRIVAQLDDADEDESIGLLLGQSKRRRGRKDSYSSFGSSVLPAPLFASNARYNPHAGSNSGLAQSRLAFPAKQGRSTYPPSNHSSAAPRSRHLAPALDTFAHPQQHAQPDTQSSRQRQPANILASRPSGFDLDDWLRTSQAPAALRSSPSLGALATFDRPDRPNRAAALSEAGTRRRRHQAGSASGLSAGVLSAGPESPRSRRKASATSTRRDASGYSSLSPDHPALMASLELSREAGSRTIDTIEEWRAKSGSPSVSNTSAAPSTVLADLGNSAAEQAELVPRRRRKSSVKSASRPVSMDGPPPPLPSIPLTFAAESVTSKSGRRRRKDVDASIASLLSPDRASLSRSKSPAVSANVQKTSPALRDLYALSGLGSQAETPVRRLIRWLAKEQLKSTIVPLVLLVSFLIRWIVARGDWSGRGVEPMHGDFEAQRHWIELTLHLPTSEWYFYDLQYWGLDYPPLTAWVSLVCGYAARLFPSTAAGFVFETSRGNEDPATAVFMRATVIVGDLLFYLPAVALFVTRKLEGRGRRTHAIALLSILLQPALVLIDHGHFQYNSIMLGLSAACFALLHTTLPNPDASSSAGATKRASRSQAVADLSRRLSYEYIAAAVLFCLSLSFKQMALYYAPAVFAVMLGRCVGLARIDPERGLTLFVGLGLAVIGTFGVVFAPWLTSLTQIGQVAHRIFPLARGLFEDKVANVWCFLSVLPLPARFKLKNVMAATALARLSLAVTLVAILPGCCLLFWAASQTARMEMMVAHETVQVKPAGKVGESVAGSVRTPTTAAPASASHRLGAARSRRSPSVIGSAAGAPARSEIESLLAGSVSKSISGRLSHVGPAHDALAISHDSEYPGAATAGARAVASTLPSPAAQMLAYGLVSVSSAFFLFGFQTHEKSILLPLLPMTLLLGAKGDTWGGNITAARDWEWSVWFNNMATFSLFPLLKKDGQALQYAVLTLAWNWALGNLASPLASLHAAAQSTSFLRRLSTLTYLAAFALHTLELLLPKVAPRVQESVWRRYPDIYPVLNVLLTTPCFAVVWVWAMVRQVQVAFANGWDVSFVARKRGRKL
ncbi:related to ALG6-glucosyltransferase [Sporisorium reilianum f. sp. reilianum]|uniref:dolichyl-P-Glc:Man9GlcNAc2-PP-dolichol alpha-1,3-glucosyltransferase n=1 Tax=Sporisorium reilianum f. sp. reilianum TaxID=72559 RepID=A0A2N8UDA2_9BASI|nr:related to ALG6-glucosyltransferase [Sporisorium reilianum f. sp. reilianum]